MGVFKQALADPQCRLRQPLQLGRQLPCRRQALFAVIMQFIGQAPLHGLLTSEQFIAQQQPGGTGMAEHAR
ncbi:hypothetical protein D3C85_1762110 [compost metagenome]